MNEVDALLSDARHAFRKRRSEIATEVEPHMRAAAMQDQILNEIVIARHVVKLMTLKDVTSARAAR